MITEDKVKMSRISKIMSLSQPLPGPGRGSHRTATNISMASIVRFYLKLFVYILFVFFILLQYINLKHSPTTMITDSTLKNPNPFVSQKERQDQQAQQQEKVAQQQQQQEKVQYQQPIEISTKIHIVFSTGCNAFQDCKSTHLRVELYCVLAIRH